MSSISYGGLLHMKSVENNDDRGYYSGRYPFDIPEIILEGYVDECYRNVKYSSEIDSIVSIRDKKIIVYSDIRSNLLGDRHYEIKEYDFENMCEKSYNVVLNREVSFNEYIINELEDYVDKEVLEEKLNSKVKK